MEFRLTPELEAFVQQQVDSGLYTSASEVAREALRLLIKFDDIQQQRLAELKREIAVGLNELERGQAALYDDESLKARIEQIKADGRKSLASDR